MSFIAKKLYLKILLPAALLSHYAMSEELREVRGQIKNAGNPANRKTSLHTQPGEEPVSLCEGGQRYSLAQLPGSVVTATGQFRSATKEQSKCFFAESYKIIEITPGRPAIVGELKALDKTLYAVVSPDGRSWKLASLAPGLKSLVGRIVVTDLIADSTSNSETKWLVVRAFAQP